MALTSDNVNLGHELRECAGSSCCPIVTASRRAVLHAGCTKLTVGVDVMGAAELPARVKAIADAFVPLSSREVSMILGLVGMAGPLPASWANAPGGVRSYTIRRILMDLPDDVLASLAKALLSNESTLIGAIGEFFLTQSEGEADGVLGMVGSRVTPGGWGGISDSAKSAVIRMLVVDLPDDALTALAEYLPSNEESRIAEEPASVPVPASEESRIAEEPARVQCQRARNRG